MPSDELRRRIEALRREGGRPQPAASVTTEPARPVSRRGASLEDTLPGEVVETEFGSLYLIERAAADVVDDADDLLAEFRHLLVRGAGGTSLSDLPRRHRKDIEQLLQLDPSRIAFLDIETMGLSCVPVFLVGVLTFAEGSGTLRQYLARDQSEERAMLARLLADLSGAEALVTFNGKSFDLPFILDRAVYSGLPADCAPHHVDLLHESRRRWRGRLCNCRLQTLECALLGHPRVGDIPGADIPRAYIDFVTSGDPREMASIVHHNALDILTMARLLLWMLAGRSVEDGPGFDLVSVQGPEVVVSEPEPLGSAQAGAGNVSARISALARSRRPAEPVPLQAAAGGSELVTDSGSCWLLERLWSENWADEHDLAGRFRHVFVRGAYEVNLADLPPDVLAFAETNPTDVAFVDVVPLGPGEGPVLLGGTLRFTGADFSVRQYVARGPAEEAALLVALLADLSDAAMMVTFGGTRCEVGLITARAKRLGLMAALPRLHLDLEAEADRRWREVLGAVTLPELERSISGRFRRRAVAPGDVAAALADLAETGNAADVARILDDNALDLVTMAEVVLFLFLARDIRED